jgi:RND family efflux transporter MFP subunit
MVRDLDTPRQEGFFPWLEIQMVVGSIFLLMACSPESTSQTTYHHRVNSLTVNHQDSYQVTRSFTGIVTAQQQAEIGFELAGKLTHIPVHEGDQVKKGQILAALDTTLLARERDELKAQLREAEAQLTLVQQNLERIDSLSKKGYASAQQQDELTSERQVLKATLERTSAALAANQTRLDKSRLRAPFDALVSRRYVDVGTVVDAGTAVLRLLEDAPMEAHIGLPIRLLAQVTVGEEVDLQTAYSKVAGAVLTISPDLDSNTRTVPIRIGLPQQAPLVDGQLIDLRLSETVKKSGFWVPMTALTDGLRGLWNVYVLVPNDTDDETKRYRLEARDVQIVHADLQRAFVSGALADGERIVASGLQRLAPGQVVILRSSSPAEQ